MNTEERFEILLKGTVPALLLLSLSAVPTSAQTATNNFGASSSIGGSRGFTSYTYRNPQTSNNPTYPNPASPLGYPTARGGFSAFANQINNTPNTSIPSYSGTSGVATTGPTSVSAGYGGLGSGSSNGLGGTTSSANTTLNLTTSSTSSSTLNTNPATNNPGFNNAGTATSNTTGIINNFSGIR